MVISLECSSILFKFRSDEKFQNGSVVYKFQMPLTVAIQPDVEYRINRNWIENDMLKVDLAKLVCVCGEESCNFCLSINGFKRVI